MNLEEKSNLKRKALRITLAEAIDEALGMTFALTIPNAKRYVTRDVMKLCRIRDSTKITMADWLIAVQICRVDRQNHFSRLSRGDITPRRDRFRIIIQALRITGSTGVISKSPYVS